MSNPGSGPNKAAIRAELSIGQVRICQVQNIGVAPEHGKTGDVRKLRVLVFTTAFPSPTRPLHGVFVRERILHLSSRADVRVVAPVPWYLMLGSRDQKRQVVDQLLVEHPPFFYVPKFFKYLDGLFLFASTFVHVGRLRHLFDFDLIDAHFAYPDGFAAILLGVVYRRPVCVTLRGTIIPLSARPILRLLCDWTINHADRVIAVASNLAERARAGGVPDSRIATISNGVDADRFRLRDPSLAKQDLKLPTTSPLIVSVGHLSRRKGFHRIIQALPRLLSSRPGLRFAIVGGRGAEPDNSAELTALVHQLGLEAHVLFVGPEMPDRVALWMAAADAFVLASDFEGCPNVVLEAMACGRPIVAGKVGHIEHMVPAFAGLLIDDLDNNDLLADTILNVLTHDWDPVLIRNHVTTRSWDEVAQSVMAEWLAIASSVRNRTQWSKSR